MCTDLGECQAKQPKGAKGKPKPEKGGVQIKYTKDRRDKAKQMPLQYKNEKLRS